MVRDGDESLEKSGGGKVLPGGSSGKSCLSGDIVLLRQKLKKTLKDPAVKIKFTAAVQPVNAANG
jgi:hypothetical protein